MLKLQSIIASTRPGRAADLVTPWLENRVKEYGLFETEVLDLRDWPLPMFAETRETIGDFTNPTYSDPVVRSWNKKIAEADAYLVLTPEYNHSIPGVLKNAIDSVFVSFALRNKPIAAVGYSGGNVGGARAVEHLAQISIEADMAPLRNSVLIAKVVTAFDENHSPNDPAVDTALSLVLEDLTWWASALASALASARALGELPPAVFRTR